ncbi:unnamed protein product [Mortierella alpina]
MHLALLNLTAAALTLALALTTVVSAQISQECVHKCDVQRATEIEAAVKAYPDYKDTRRLEAIDKAQDNYFDVCNYKCVYPERYLVNLVSQQVWIVGQVINFLLPVSVHSIYILLHHFSFFNLHSLIAVDMRFSLTSTLYFTVCAMAAFTSTEAKNPSVACRDLCTSFSVGECVKKYKPITSNTGVKCINEAVQPYTGACKDECMKQLVACDNNCFVVVGPNWESCVDQYADSKDPKRIQCIKDVEDPLRNCRLAC